jgi:hypothetical protein
MPITFYATITWKRKQPMPGGVRYMPNIRFDLPGLETLRFGLTTMDDAEWPLCEEETKLVHLHMIGAREPEFERLAKDLRESVQFVLLEGSQEVASGIVNEIETRTIDEPRLA